MNGKEYSISDYALIGNCETAALINTDGGIDWLCLPAFDAPSFFGAILDRVKGGDFVIRPRGTYRVIRCYEEDTAILETRFFAEDGSVVKLTDFFVVARRAGARFHDFTSLHPTHKLVRLVEVESGGPVGMTTRVAARPDYARGRPEWQSAEGGFECTETALFSNLPLEKVDGDLSLDFVLQKGRPAFLVLDHGDSRHAPGLEEVGQWLEITRDFWQEWNLFNYYRGPREKMIRRSAVTLKLLTYAPTGAIIAAPTTSLPEKLGGDLNWDYRFSWVRDTALLINNLFRLGYSGEARAFYEFLTRGHEERAKSGNHQLPVLLPIRPETAVEEEMFDHLAGYGGSLPVRRGNRVEDQFQFDNQGFFLQSLYFWKHCGGIIDGVKHDMAIQAMEFLRDRWRDPDNGTWEPLERSQHCYSKGAAWTGLQRARDLGLLDRDEADRLCDEIHREVMEKGIRNPDGLRYMADHYETDAVDATALLSFTAGFLPPDLGRSTREMVERRLGDGALIYRTEGYREQGEGGFLLCSFWRIGHLIREGELDRAEALLDRMIAAASPLGLFSEEMDPSSGEFLGNFPQAFSHLGVISAILDLEEARRNPRFGPLPDHRKFTASVGRAIGARAVIEGFLRVPATLRLITSRRSIWPGRNPGREGEVGFEDCVHPKGKRVVED